MTKELEALERLKTAPSFMGGTVEYQACTQSEVLLMQDYEIVKQALLELKSIKEANPSEALKCLELLGDFEWHNKSFKEAFSDLFNTIKQALLRQQEPKKYLKWEDLDFKEVSQLDHKIIKAKLNEQLYELDLYRYGGYKRVEIRAVGGSYNYNLGEGYVMCIDEEFPETIQFFNDLHLERVEE